uniref:C-type lectin domain-containing protein n=1 Tax=Labrus bergylta TaxID=56723 RepID=A0A3Q3GGX6_9LABR
MSDLFSYLYTIKIQNHLHCLITLRDEYKTFAANPPGQRTFVLIQKAMNWTDAREYCRNHHTDLAMMLTEPEARDLGTVKGPHRVWIGMYREPWRWSDNRNSSFKNWGRGEPSNYASAQYCVYFYRDKTWGDSECSKLFPFWCQTGDKRKLFS